MTLEVCMRICELAVYSPIWRELEALHNQDEESNASDGTPEKEGEAGRVV